MYIFLNQEKGKVRDVILQILNKWLEWEVSDSQKWWEDKNFAKYSLKAMIGRNVPLGNGELEWQRFVYS